MTNQQVPRPQASQPFDRLVAFLNAIHGTSAAGVIELRVIEDRPNGALVDRRWFESAAHLLEALPELQATAEARSAAVFYGVLRRRAQGSGTSSDCLDGAVAWTDIDFKDFAGGESEARQRLAAFQHAPSFLVRSGHGLHAYWILRESAEPAELSDLSKVLGRALGGDHTHDAARMLRLPGTFNRKDPTQPILVEFEVFEPDRCFNPSDLSDAAELVSPPRATKPALRALPPADHGEYEDPVAPPIPERVLALLQRHKRLARLFNGQGKPEVGPGGAELDRSSSGYDFSFVLALIKAGVTETDQLHAALANRPDGAALGKGARYLARTVANALAMREEVAANAATELDFEVKELRLFNSNPARYQVTVDGVTFLLRSAELRSPKAFALAFMDALHRVPTVPTKSDAWRDIVNGWLKGAVVVEQPPEASREPRLVDAVAIAIAALPVGDAVEDLDHGKSIALEGGHIGFKTAAIQRLLRDEWPDVDAADVSRVLRKLGFESTTVSIDGLKARVWSSTGGPS